jgi:hypothetical protein
MRQRFKAVTVVLAVIFLLGVFFLDFTPEDQFRFGHMGRLG